MNKKKCGIYKITGPGDRVYVGQTKDLWSRWNDHVSDLQEGKHTNPHLQHAWNAYGPASFSFSLIEEIYWCDDTLDAREAFWGEKLEALTKGYNTQPFNAPPSGGRNLYSKPKFVTHPNTGLDLVRHLNEGKNKSEN
jgi:group I intron endonuclease